MKTHYLSLLSAPFCLILATPQAFSASEELIVTGSYTPVSSEQLAASVSVINKQQLLNLGGNNLIAALRQIPSIWVEEQGGPGGITSINLRGAESNHTLVLLDGVQLNDPTNTRGGAFDLNGINIESIERIEIIRGAQSAIYGSDALAGVIHIITRQPGKTVSRFNASIGEQGYGSAGISTRGRIDQLGYAIGFQNRDGGEPVEGSTAKNNEFMGQLDWQQGAHALDLAYRYFDGERTSYPEQSGGPEFAQSPSLDNSDYTDQQAALGWMMQVNDFWRSKASATWYQRDEEYTSPGILPYDAVPPNGATNDFTRTTVTWVNTLGNQQRLWSNIGVETREEKGNSQGYLNIGFIMPTDFSLERLTHSAFINVNGYLGSALLLQASVRRDDAEHLAGNNSSQLGARYSVNEQLSVFTNWGEGYKLPSFFALGHPLVGNPDLKPETATTAEMGFDWSNGVVATRFSVFDHRYRNLIDFDSEAFANVNRARVDTEGVEAELSWQISQELDWRIQGTYTDIDMLSSDNHLLGRPQTTYGTSWNYRPLAAWTFNVNYLHVDERFAVSRYTGAGIEETLESYQRIDASAYWQFDNHITFGLNLENLRDSDYYTDIGFPAPGRRVVLKLDIQF